MVADHMNTVKCAENIKNCLQLTFIKSIYVDIIVLGPYYKM